VSFTNKIGTLLQHTAGWLLLNYKKRNFMFLGKRKLNALARAEGRILVCAWHLWISKK